MRILRCRLEGDVDVQSLVERDGDETIRMAMPMLRMQQPVECVIPGCGCSMNMRPRWRVATDGDGHAGD